MEPVINYEMSWENVQKIIPPLFTKRMLLEEKLTPCVYNALHALLDPARINYLSDKENALLYEMQQTLKAGLAIDTYSKFFNILFSLEELNETLQNKKYDMYNVNFTINTSTSVLLNVPGLVTRRPYLVRGDSICAKLHGQVDYAYMGIITSVDDDEIEIDEFEDEFLEEIDNHTKVDISFNLSRGIYDRMQQAIYSAEQWHNTKIFPEKALKVVIPDFAMFNNAMNHNQEQKQAVRNIVANTSGTAPYILFGPPGTGKSVTIVEAIHQILSRKPDARVLVCAPSNAACDSLTALLAKRIDPSELIRVHSNNRPWSTVPYDIQAYSNYSYESGYERFTAADLNEYRVIVCTLAHTGRYTGDVAGEETLKVTHVFIDEAGQAKEPECLIPFIGIPTIETQLVLAGDPKQLAPFVLCSKANSYGLGTSLLERLMSTCPLYNVERSCRDPNYITKLVKNFRSHPAILQISNDKFYDNEIEACSYEAEIDPIVQLNILESQHVYGQAVTFHGVHGDGIRSESSTSYFNLMEVDVVLQYVTALLSSNCPVKVLTSEIGIISPYLRQVQIITEELHRLGIYREIEVGSTEAFQGKEKRIVIISTVRGSSDDECNLGFVADQRRFNVALTRAKSKLIVIGNPDCLMTRDGRNCWPHYLDLCSSYYSNIGYKCQDRDAWFYS